MSNPLPASCWAIHDGTAGNRRQALALAEALGLPIREWALSARGLGRWLAPRQVPGRSNVFGGEFASALLHSPPTLAIGCGRIAALATRQARSAGAKSVQILNPRISSHHWDLVVAPEHDGLTGANVVNLVGSLNPVNARWLESARHEFPLPGTLAQPRTAVLLGGPTRATRFDRSALEVLLSKLEYWLARDGGSVQICGSRRTPPEWAALIRDRYRDPDQLVWMDQSDGSNTYAAVLAWADRIIVSPDSVNMISEACATAVPVFVAEPGRATGRIRSFIESLQRRDRIRAQTHDRTPFAVTPLDETRRITALVRQKLKLG